MLAHGETLTSNLLKSAAPTRTAFESLLAEDQSLLFFSEIIGADYSIFRKGALSHIWLVLSLSWTNGMLSLMIITRRVSNIITKKMTIAKHERRSPLTTTAWTGLNYNEEIDGNDLVSKFRDVRSKMWSAAWSLAGLIAIIYGALSIFRLEGLEQLVMDVALDFKSSPSDAEKALTLFASGMIAAIISLIGIVFSFGVSVSYPRLAVFRRIIASRMRKKPECQDRLAFKSVNSECLVALSNSAESGLAEVMSRRSRGGQMSMSPESELRESILPHG